MVSLLPLVMLLLYLFHSYFFPFLLLHGDSLLYKCKYFLVALQILAVLAYTLVLHLLPCCLADLPGDCSVAIHLWILNKTGSNLETRLDFAKMVQLSKTGSEFKNILRDVPECKQSVDEEV